MTTSIVDLNGVDLRSTPLFYTDCSMPVLNWIKHCPPDDVIRNFPIVVGSWNSGTVVPAITDIQVDIDLSTVCDPDCDSATVMTTLDGCELMMPDMKEIPLSTKQLKLTDWKNQFCRPRNIAPDRFCVFNRDGTLNEGEELIIDFAAMALTGLKMAMAQLISRTALVGDFSNPFEVDGLYTQIDNGWAPGNFGDCSDEVNVGVEIDWAALTGNTECTSPDAETIATTITIWGEDCQVPSGLTLAQFLEDIWIPKVRAHWTDRHGGVDAWEFHVGYGAGKCLLNNSACMQPCHTCGSQSCVTHDDVELRSRFADQHRTGVVELYPSGTRIPVLETKWMEGNTLRLGPRSIGGFPTYGLFFQDIDAMLPEFPSSYGTGFGIPEREQQFPMIKEDVVDFPLEERTLYWALTRENLRCFKAEMMSCVGVVSCWRHLWLKITNVCCCECIGGCDDSVTISGTMPNC